MSGHDKRKQNAPRQTDGPGPGEQKPLDGLSNGFIGSLLPSLADIGGGVLDALVPEMPGFSLPGLEDLLPDIPVPEVPIPGFEWPSIPTPEMPRMPQMPGFDWPWSSDEHAVDKSPDTKSKKRTATAFSKLADGGSARKDAPQTVQLPDVVDKGMQTAWDGSLPDGNSQEQGGILVQNEDGSYEWKAGAAGKSGSFTLNTNDAGPGETIVGSGHTHPYGKNDGSAAGETGIAFSGGDLANMVTQDGNVKFGQSGDQRFMVSKTKEWDALITAADTPEKKEALSTEMKALWNTTFGEGKGSFKENCDAAALAVSNTYHLNYYKGEGKTMNLQNPKEAPGAKTEAP